MFQYFSRIFKSEKTSQLFDTIFDFAILLSIIRLSIVVLTGAFEPLLSEHTAIFGTIFDQKKAITVSLNTLILVKIYKVLHHFLGDHHIKMIDLIEIAATSVIIKMVFDLNYSRQSIIVLIILLGFFIILNYMQKQGFLLEEETHQYDIKEKSTNPSKN